MTETPKAGKPRPAVVFAILAAVVFVVVVLMPQSAVRNGEEGGLTTYSTAPDGAAIAYDLARRFGWHTERREVLLDSVVAPNVIEAILEPDAPISASQTHLLLESVRHGSALLIGGVPPDLVDSLHFRAGASQVLFGSGRDSVDSIGTDSNTFVYRAGSSSSVRGGRRDTVLERELTPDCQARMDSQPLAATIVQPVVAPVQWVAPPPSHPVTIGRARPLRDELGGIHSSHTVVHRRGRPDSVVDRVVETARGFQQGTVAAEGVELGKGRIVIVAGPTLLRNEVLRLCSYDADVDFVRALEYLTDGSPRRAVVEFDEYDHGYGVHPGGFRAIALFIRTTPAGRMLAAGILAGLVLLCAAAPRPVAPRDPERAARRSPLEQADALAHAYATVKGTRTVALRLLGGVRRRAPLARATRDLSDEAFLTRIASLSPALAGDVETVRRALRAQIPQRELPALGDALRHLEDALTHSGSSPRTTT